MGPEASVAAIGQAGRIWFHGVVMNSVSHPQEGPASDGSKNLKASVSEARVRLPLLEIKGVGEAGQLHLSLWR